MTESVGITCSCMEALREGRPNHFSTFNAHGGVEPAHSEAHWHGHPHNHIPRRHWPDTDARFGACGCHHYDVTDRADGWFYQASSPALVKVAMSGLRLPEDVDRSSRQRGFVQWPGQRKGFPG